jgi:hypothetical protein
MNEKKSKKKENRLEGEEGKEPEEKEEAGEEARIEEENDNKTGESEEEILLDNSKTFIGSAKTIYLKKDFTSATILYFKALFSILDLIILKDKGKSPKDHGERFRILERDYPNFYILLDKIYPVYRDTYNVKINKETCDSIKKDVERIAKEQGILQNNK